MDAADRIVSVGGAWTRFAVENDAPELQPERVVGRSLWDFVSDPTTRQVYAALLARVRAGRDVALTIRCDAPRARRTVDLRMTGRDVTGAGRVGFSGRVVEEDSRPEQPALQRGATRGADLVTSCSWCARVLVDGAWREIEDAVAALGLFESETVPRFTHGMCPACFESFTAHET